MRVSVLFFGMLKDVTGIATDQIDLPEPASLSTVWDHYSRQFPAMAAMRNHVRLALNHEFAKPDTAVAPGDEVAFLPPVSGGSDSDSTEAVQVQLKRAPIDTRALMMQTRADSDGAVLTFEGVVRNQSHGRATRYLEYECYEPMALRMMRQLCVELRSRHAIDKIAMVHRLGKLEVGEASVVIVVSAPHRKPAFAACLEAIDTLKATVPIWKKEYFEDGAVWVQGEWDDQAIVR